MDESSFQLPVAGIDVLVRIILGYYHAGAGREPVPVSTVADSTAMKRPNVSANNKFLESLNLLEKSGKGYQLTSSGIHLAQQLDYDKESKNPDTQSAWGNVVDSNDFLQRMTTAVRIRGNMDSEAFARHIALTSGAPNKPQFMRGARTVIAILQAANKVLEDDDGTLKTSGVEISSYGKSISQPTTVSDNNTAIIAKTTPILSQMGTPLSIMVQITPETTNKELEELARKIKYLSQLIASDSSVDEEDVELS